MNAILWVLQGLLAAFFLMAGYGKVSSSRQHHIDSGHIKPDSSIVPIRILGVLEMLGSVGIIVPCLVGIAPVLTPVTAVCFCLVMVGSLVVHIQKKGYKFLPLPVIIIAMASLVAYYRLGAGVPQ